jgi:hypothetical protein
VKQCLNEPTASREKSGKQSALIQKAKQGRKIKIQKRGRQEKGRIN